MLKVYSVLNHYTLKFCPDKENIIGTGNSADRITGNSATGKVKEYYYFLLIQRE